jgi:hypothetical protein
MPHPINIKAVLARLSELPDTAVVPVSVAAAHDGVGLNTVRRNYPLVQISPGLFGVTVGYLRRHREPKQAA